MALLLRVKERIVGPSGVYGIQNEWYGYADEFKYTIGLAGLMGFGVGCCRPEILPGDMVPMPGCEDRFSPNYGNYIHTPSASIMCFLPKHYIDIRDVPDINGPNHGQPIIINSTQFGDAVLARAFRNGGLELEGIFVDKYQPSNCRPDGTGRPNSPSGAPGEYPSSGGVAASRPLHWPLSPHLSGTQSSPFSLCNSTALNPTQGTPTNNYAGCWSVVRSRGSSFHPAPIWVYSQLAYLSMAHAQALLDSNANPASGAASVAAWMDGLPYAPKGNNSSVASDIDQPLLRFDRSDIPGHVAGGAGVRARSFTGAAYTANPFNPSSPGSPTITPRIERTTHNGQASGVVDLNGNVWECAPGLTNIDGTASGYRMVADSVDWGAISSNADILARATVALAADTSDDGIWWSNANSWAYLESAAGGTYHPVSTWDGQPTRQAMTECMLPRQGGTEETQSPLNAFGGDALFRGHVSDVMPVVGGAWSLGSAAGVFSVIINGSATFSTIDLGGVRAIRMLPGGSLAPAASTASSSRALAQKQEQSQESLLRQSYGGSDNTASSFNHPQYLRFYSLGQSQNLGILGNAVTDIDGVVGSESGSNSTFFRFAVAQPSRISLQRQAVNQYTDQYVSIALRDSEGRQIPLDEFGINVDNDPAPVIIQQFNPGSEEGGYALSGYWRTGYALFDDTSIPLPPIITISSGRKAISKGRGVQLPAGQYAIIVSNSQWSKLPYRFRLSTAIDEGLRGSCELSLLPASRLSLGQLSGDAVLSLEPRARLRRSYNLAGAAILEVRPRATLRRLSPFG